MMELAGVSLVGSVSEGKFWGSIVIYAPRNITRIAAANGLMVRGAPSEIRSGCFKHEGLRVIIPRIHH